MAAPTRFVNGVTTVPVNSNLGMFPLPDPTEVCVNFNDFNQYVAGDWTVTNTTSHATIGLVAASSTVPAGGVIGLVGGASSATNDVAAIIANPANFYFTSSTPVWFYCHLNLATAANDLVIAGLTSANATGVVTNGIYFSKSAGSANVDFVVKKTTATTQTTVATMTDGGNIELGFYYNGKDGVDVFVNETKVYQQTTLTYLPTAVALAPGVAMKLAATSPTTAALYSDFILAAQGRNF